MELNDHSVVTLYPLNIRKDKKNYIVENIESGEFFEMPAICIDAIGLITKGCNLAEIEDTLKLRYPDEEVDIKCFIHDLLELGLISSLDGKDILRDQLNRKERSGLVWISPKVGRFFFNKFTSRLYLTTFIASLLIFLLNPNLFPTYKDIFVFELMMNNIFAFLSITFLLVVVHEIGHVLAVRAEGLPTRIEVGHRLVFVVLETDMSRVWSLPPNKRNRLYLAGMYFDGVILLIGLLGQMLFPANSLVVGMAQMIVFSTFIRIIFQCCVFMKTDFYYILENETGCYNLMENGQNFLKRWLPFLPAVKTSESFEGEDRLVKPFAVFYLIGVGITIAVLVGYNIPLIIHAGILVVPGFSESVNSILFWDAVVFYLQFVLVLGLLTYSWMKKYRVNY